MAGTGTTCSMSFAMFGLHGRVPKAKSWVDWSQRPNWRMEERVRFTNILSIPAIPKCISHSDAKHFILTGHKTTFLSGIFCRWTSAPQQPVTNDAKSPRCCRSFGKSSGASTCFQCCVLEGTATLFEGADSQLYRDSPTTTSIPPCNLFLFGMNTASGAVSKPTVIFTQIPCSLQILYHAIHLIYHHIMMPIYLLCCTLNLSLSIYCNSKHVK